MIKRIMCILGRPKRDLEVKVVAIGTYHGQHYAVVQTVRAGHIDPLVTLNSGDSILFKDEIKVTLT